MWALDIVEQRGIPGWEQSSLDGTDSLQACTTDTTDGEQERVTAFLRTYKSCKVIELIAN